MAGWIKIVSDLPEHASKTCVVLRGIAKSDHMSVAANGKEVRVWKGEEVIVKLMTNAEQFKREVNGRTTLHRLAAADDSVLGIVANSADPDVSSRWETEVAKLPQGVVMDGIYPQGIIMEAAQRNLMVILVSFFNSGTSGLS